MYPASAGFVAGSATSRAAADAFEPHLKGLQRQVYCMFLLAKDGLTDHELQARAHTDTLLRPRRCELVELGKLKDSGTTRKGPSGKPMTVWVLA